MSAGRSAGKAASRITTAVIILLCVVLIPVLAVNATLLFNSFLRPDEVPSFLGYKPFIVLSGSMETVFYSGDVIVVKVTGPDTLKEQDIIAFRSGASMVTHRIVRIAESEAGEKQFTTRGDNNNIDDELTITADMIEGKYLFHVPDIGDFAMFLQTQTGILVFVAVPLISFILYDVFRRALVSKRAAKKFREFEVELERMRSEYEIREVKSEAEKFSGETPEDKE